jgi:hypothetical protein
MVFTDVFEYRDGRRQAINVDGLFACVLSVAFYHSTVERLFQRYRFDSAGPGGLRRQHKNGRGRPPHASPAEDRRPLVGRAARQRMTYRDTA